MKLVSSFVIYRAKVITNTKEYCIINWAYTVYLYSNTVN